MRYQGKIKHWKDDQGFGFVTPNGGGQKAFVHIKAFSNSARRPIDGDIITYELATDKSGRFFAKNILFAMKSTASSIPNKSSAFITIFLIVFALFLFISAILGRLPSTIVWLYFISSMVTFFAYAIDKSAAQHRRWRIKERTLYVFGFVGGWPGALLAQKILHHKSKKQAFQTMFWATVIANCFILGWLLLTKSGSTFLSLIIGHIA